MTIEEAEVELERLRNVVFPWQPEDSQSACDLIAELLSDLKFKIRSNKRLSERYIEAERARQQVIAEHDKQLWSQAKKLYKEYPLRYTESWESLAPEVRQEWYEEAKRVAERLQEGV